MTNDGKKKRNTAIFITIATIANIVLMMAFFLIGMVIMNAVVSEDDSTGITIGFLLVFFFSVGLSWFIYSRFVKWYMKKVNTDETFAPIFSSKRRPKK
jgi:cation transporter-like permease